MHEALTGLLDTADHALAAVGEVVGPTAVAPTARVVGDARFRLDYPDDVIVAALAGGTGSGKSSLFNAMTGTDAAPIGDVRPTTSEPLAAVPAGRPGVMDGYLDRMGVGRRVAHDSDHLCVIDLPDTDSVVAEHRHRVESVLPRIDVLIWVVDPEKYRDSALHHRYLQPLAGYASQFLFVFNRVDRVRPEDADRVIEDLRVALDEDGIAEPRVLSTAVAPKSPSHGVDEVMERIREMARYRETLYRKLILDLGRASTELESAVGMPIGYRDLLSPVVDSASAAMVEGDRDIAASVLGAFCEEVAAKVGGLPAERVRLVAAGLPTKVADALARLPELERTPLLRKVRPESKEQRQQSARRSVERMLAPVTEVMTERARALALTAELAVGAERLRQLAS
jgi:GTP-binding protein EngB required for normal cell division